MPDDASGWQPIETAPRDGTRIVLAELEPGGIFHEDSRWNFWTDYWRKYHEPYGEGFGHPARPTHWMPLPAPPLAAEAEGHGVKPSPANA